MSCGCRGLVKALIRAAQSSGVQAPRVDAKDRERLQLLERHIEGMENEDDVDSEFTLIRQPDVSWLLTASRSWYCRYTGVDKYL